MNTILSHTHIRRRMVIALLLSVTAAVHAQGALPWGYAVSPPVLAAQPENAMFYVSSYNQSDGHTQYDMARLAADAYLLAHPQTPTFLILTANGAETCDSAPLPTVFVSPGVTSSVSIVGYGSNSSSIIKRAGCGPSAATLQHAASSLGAVTNALYQGFTVNGNHIDDAACEFYGMSTSTFLDLSCINAKAGSDHEVEFGSTASKSAGMDYKLNIYNLKAGDSVGTGKGAILEPSWANGTLASVSLKSGGTRQYTQQYTRAQIVGPDVTSCSVLPVIEVMVSNLFSINYPNLPTVNYGWVTGANIKNVGKCASTARLYFLIQDGAASTYEMKFSYIMKSQIWNLEPTGAGAYGEAWLPKSGNNKIIGEHPYTNQTIQIADYAVANQHSNAFFDSPGLYGAAIYGATGEFVNSVFSWDGSDYLASSGYFLGSSVGYVNWVIQNSQCTDSIANFSTVTTVGGALAPNSPLPSGFVMRDIERCDGSQAIDWVTQVSSE